MADEVPADPVDGLSDKYYVGTIAKLFAGSERGVVRTATGREIPFKFAHVRVVGERRRFSDLTEGATVGYDVSWTSHGLRVSVLRLPD